MSMSASDQTSRPSVRSLPTERDLERLSCAIRVAAREREFPQRVIDRYEAWIFLFVAWCLKASPFDIRKSRIGDFHSALRRHPGASRWELCEAMDALGFLFGTLGGPRELSFPGGQRGEGAGGLHGRDDLTDERDELTIQRPNPTLRAADDEKETALEDRGEELRRYLPEGNLPMGVDAWAEVPTQEGGEEGFSASGSREAPTTLFNPSGAAPPPGETGASKASPEANTSGNASAEENSTAEGGESEAVDTPMEDRPTLRDTGPSGAQPPTPRVPERQPAPPKSGATEEKVSLKVPSTVADRLQAAAKKLGLPPAVFAARAIDLVCGDAGIEDAEQPPLYSLVEQYQAQLDLLHLGDSAALANPSSIEASLSTGRDSPAERGRSPEVDGTPPAPASEGLEVEEDGATERTDEGSVHPTGSSSDTKRSREREAPGDEELHEIVGEILEDLWGDDDHHGVRRPDLSGSRPGDDQVGKGGDRWDRTAAPPDLPTS